jgi:thiol-disulfide isomerase/thioredoxin
MRSWSPSVRGPAVLFVKAEWCPHCQTAKPEMEKAALMLGSVIPMYAVDSEKHKRFVQQARVPGFPAIFFMTPEGELVQYDGERKGQQVADWACISSGLCGAGRTYRPM